MDGVPPTVSPSGRRRSGTRGFLFADLRGYTAFLERRGADDAATLLERYRLLVRAAVDEHEGAEIRTEGDSFYVVFPDASGAVACGLAIARAAAEATDSEAEMPIRVGIGVHAGETVETSEGYVGAAVNLAARLCAAAPAGEVLVSDTVRALTAGVTPIRYEQRGRRRLKGIAEPVSTYRALGEGDAVARSSRSRWPLVTGGAAALSLGVLVVALVGGALTREGLGSDPPAGSTTPSPTVDMAGPTAKPPPSAAEATARAEDASAEDQLRALVDERYRPSCRTTRENQTPRYAETRNDAVGPVTWPLDIKAGIVCAPFRLEAPDELGFWTISDVYLALNETDVIFNLAGQRGARTRSCTEELPATEAWAAGPITGYRLCYLQGDSAFMYWTYDRTNVIARAIRRDGDMSALLSWWNSDARFRRP